MSVKRKGIDVSSWQKNIDWDKVKAAGIEFAILRCGFGQNLKKQDDNKFKRNADECTRLGIPFGVYLYSYATTTDMAVGEAEHVLRLIEGYKLDYPVFYDLEDPDSTQKCSKTLIADMAEVFCNKIKAAGYAVGIYANLYWFNSILTDNRFNQWDRWVAQYHTECQYKKEYTMWQYTSEGQVNGIIGNVDVNYCYVDYPGMGAISKPDEAVKPVEKPDEYISYPIKKGDTLTKIARAYNTTVDELVALNNIANKDIIYAGDTLKIPLKAQGDFKPYTVRVATKVGLNVRKSPVIRKDNKVNALPYGTEVMVMEESNGWGRTSDGWICLDYTIKI